ncbi:MAG TPA: hypothetical protein VGE11_00860, partial [Pseudonocardia sp.]
MAAPASVSGRACPDFPDPNSSNTECAELLSPDPLSPEPLRAEPLGPGVIGLDGAPAGRAAAPPVGPTDPASLESAGRRVTAGPAGGAVRAAMAETGDGAAELERPGPDVEGLPEIGKAVVRPSDPGAAGRTPGAPDEGPSAPPGLAGVAPEIFIATVGPAGLDGGGPACGQTASARSCAPGPDPPEAAALGGSSDADEVPCFAD